MSLNLTTLAYQACRDIGLNVRPRFAVNDLGNGCSVYSHIPADGSHGFTSRIKSADVQNLRIRELGKSVLLSAKIYISTLALAVFHIVLVCAGKQMRRVDAVWVIAGMAYTQFSRIISGGQIKRNPVSPKWNGFYEEDSVASFVQRSSPSPAAFGLRHATPKTNNHRLRETWDCFGCHVTTLPHGLGYVVKFDQISIPML